MGAPRRGEREGWQEQLIAVPSIQTVAACSTRGIEDVTAETPVISEPVDRDPW